MERRDPKALQSLLPKLLARLAQQSGQARGLAPVWAEAVGAQIAKHTSPYLLEKGTLVVTVASAEWALTLEREQASLLERLNAQLGPGTVTGLTFRLEAR